MHWDILDEGRRRLLPRLAFLKERGFYLAGGTALALQLGHRRSVDFDFYNQTSFNEMGLERDIVTQVEGFKVTQRGSGTLIGQQAAIDMSFFYYPYPLLESLLETESLNLVSIQDIAAMKLIAISQRGLRRDFLDLYVICQERPLEKIFACAQEKYTQFDPYVCLKALTYFEDADRDESGRGMELRESVSWDKVKKFFEENARRLAKLWM
jgi:predicted nucleotidyltransferase component of viral defense system